LPESSCFPPVLLSQSEEEPVSQILRSAPL
jgi:hypothetical protein